MLTNILLLFLFSQLMPQVDCFTFRTVLNNKTCHVNHYLVFDIPSSRSTNCYSEYAERGNQLLFSLVALNSQKQSLFIRVTTPSGIMTKWLRGVNKVVYQANAAETGYYEVCASAEVRYGAVRVVLGMEVADIGAANVVINLVRADSEAQVILSKSVNGIYTKVRQMLTELFRASFKARLDTLLQLNNVIYIDSFSALQTVFMIVSGVAQVIVIRKFFYVDETKIRA